MSDAMHWTAGLIECPVQKSRTQSKRSTLAQSTRFVAPSTATSTGTKRADASGDSAGGSSYTGGDASGARASKTTAAVATCGRDCRYQSRRRRGLAFFGLPVRGDAAASRRLGYQSRRRRGLASFGLPVAAKFGASSRLGYQSQRRRGLEPLGLYQSRRRRGLEPLGLPVAATPRPRFQFVRAGAPTVSLNSSIIVALTAYQPSFANASAGIWYLRGSSVAARSRRRRSRT